MGASRGGNYLFPWLVLAYFLSVVGASPIHVDDSCLRNCSCDERQILEWRDEYGEHPMFVYMEKMYRKTCGGVGQQSKASFGPVSPEMPMGHVGPFPDHSLMMSGPAHRSMLETDHSFVDCVQLNCSDASVEVFPAEKCFEISIDPGVAASCTFDVDFRHYDVPFSGLVCWAGVFADVIYSSGNGKDSLYLYGIDEYNTLAMELKPEVEEVVEGFPASVAAVLMAKTTTATAGLHMQGYLHQLSSCGDYIIDYLEECDDGNNEDGDGCSSCCQVEEGFVCWTHCDGASSECEEHCGDGYVQDAQGEECDDGNHIGWDGCAGCSISTHSQNNDILVDAPVCENGVVVETTSTTGTVLTSIAPNTNCSWEIHPADDEIWDCFVVAFNVTDLGGADVKVYSYEDQTLSCKTSDFGVTCGGVLALPKSYMSLPSGGIRIVLSANESATVGSGLEWFWSTVPDCGDASVTGFEQCDAGSKSSEGCQCCAISAGHTCDPAGGVFAEEPAEEGKSTCHISCGDGTVEHDVTTAVYEECDDGNAGDYDGCAECMIASGYVCEGEPSVCWLITCGDGVIDEGEECDDMNTDPLDGCYLCHIENYAHCDGEPSVCECLTGTAPNADGVCELLDDVVIAVGRYENAVDCDCQNNVPETCCYQGALDILDRYPLGTVVTICLHDDQPHTFRFEMSRRVVSNRTVIVEPCVEGEYPEINLVTVSTFIEAVHGDVTLRHLRLYKSEGTAVLASDKANLTMIDMHFDDGVNGESGATYFDASSGSVIVVENCVLTVGNGRQVGTFRVQNSALHMTGTEVSSSQSLYGQGGGGIIGPISDDSPTIDGTHTVILANCEFRNNHASGAAALFVRNAGTVQITDTVFEDNAILGNEGGSAMVIQQTDVSMHNVRFINNTVETHLSTSAGDMPTAAVILEDVTRLEVTDSLFMSSDIADSLNGTVHAIGGALFVHDLATANIENTRFVGNRASVGAAVYVRGTVHVEECTFEGNIAATAGAAMYVTSDAVHKLTSTTCTFSGNQAPAGAIVYAETSAYPTLRGVIVDGSLSSTDIHGELAECPTFSSSSSTGTAVCGLNAICGEASKDSYGIICTCPPGSDGNPYDLCQTPTGITTKLRMNFLERTLVKPATAQECILLEPSGGIGQNNATIHWELVNPPNTTWLSVHTTSGTVEAGQCGKTEAVACSEDVSDPTVAVIPLTFSTRGLIDGDPYTAYLTFISDADLRREMPLNVSLNVKTVGNANNSYVFLSDEEENHITEWENGWDSFVDKTLTFFVQAVDVDDFPLNHAGDSVYVEVGRYSADTCVWTDEMEDDPYVVARTGNCDQNAGDSDDADDGSDGSGDGGGGSGSAYGEFFSGSSASRRASSAEVDFFCVYGATYNQSGSYSVTMTPLKQGRYCVRVFLNDGEVLNSPVRINAECADGYLKDSSGYCIEEENDMTVKVIIIVLVVGVSVTSVTVGLVYMYSRKEFMTELIMEVVQNIARLCLEVADIITDWFAYITVQNKSEFSSYVIPYQVAISFATLISAISLAMRCGTFFVLLWRGMSGKEKNEARRISVFEATHPDASQPVTPIKMAISWLVGKDRSKDDPSLLAAEAERSDAAGVGGERRRGREGARPVVVDGVALDQASAQPRMGGGHLVRAKAKYVQRYTEVTWDWEVTLGRIRGSYVTLAVALLEDVPMGIMNMLIVFEAGETDKYVLASLLVTCLLLGIKFGTLFSLYGLLKTRDRLALKRENILRRLKDAESQGTKRVMSVV